MKPLSFLAQYHYTEGLMVITGIIAFAISIKNYRRHRDLRIFTFYLLFSLTQIAVDFCHYMQPEKRFLVKMDAITTLSFMLFENIVCITFIYSLLVSPKRKLAVALLPVFFVIGVVFMLKLKSITGVFVFFLMDCIVLTIPCLLYFCELFLYPSDKPLKNQPAFWVTTGILFLNCMSIPLYLLIGVKEHDLHEASWLNFLLYAALYSMVARAFLCRPVTKASTGKANPAKTDAAGTSAAESGATLPRVAVRLAGRRNIEPIN